jgi:transcriptional regulator GlxA family with amidase domain
MGEDAHQQDLSSVPQPPIPTSELDPMLKRVMQFIEENISNGDVGVGDMAEAAATSRSGLQRKLKHAMGITPQELLSEARIKRACQLLRQSDKTISEVAFSCGFNDPKYFSRCFKQSTGKTPKEYREQP